MSYVEETLLSERAELFDELERQAYLVKLHSRLAKKAFDEYEQLENKINEIDYVIQKALQ